MPRTQGTSPVYYEAESRVRTARPYFTQITMPSITKTTFLVSTMLIIGTFQVFDQAFVTKGGLEISITLVYYIYNNS